MVEYTRLEEWSQYMERLEFFFTANGIDNTSKDGGRQKAILLSVIRSKKKIQTSSEFISSKENN